MSQKSRFYVCSFSFLDGIGKDDRIKAHEDIVLPLGRVNNEEAHLLLQNTACDWLSAGYHTSTKYQCSDDHSPNLFRTDFLFSKYKTQSSL